MEGLVVTPSPDYHNEYMVEDHEQVSIVWYNKWKEYCYCWSCSSRACEHALAVWEYLEAHD